MTLMVTKHTDYLLMRGETKMKVATNTKQSITLNEVEQKLRGSGLVLHAQYSSGRYICRAVSNTNQCIAMASSKTLNEAVEHILGRTAAA